METKDHATGGAPAHVAADHPTDHPAGPPSQRRHRKRWILLTVVLLLVAGVAVWLGPTIVRSFTTVSTDDAYVNGHVTFVAPRVAGQVKLVKVDDNYRVKKDDLLLELDPEPYQVQVDLKLSAVTVAEAERRSAESQVRGLLAQARSNRWKLQAAMESVDNQVALLHARVATLRSAEATRDRAEADLVRVKEAFGKGAGSKQDLDAAVASKKVADAQVGQALEEVREVRVALGLPPQPENNVLTSVPDNLNQSFSSVRQALADLVQIVAQVGLPLTRSEATPKEVLDDFRRRDASQDIDKVLAALIPDAPAVKQAEARLFQAKRDLAQAELNLRYCKVRAEIDGVITRRNVNPGNNVQVGQQVMAIRSLTEIWVDANFKETQIADLAIGQRVDVYADVYGSRKLLRGRITGFTSGTGSTLALLPPQNATGNFVKVVQRLPVRVEFDDYDPDRDTLFTGLSVVPYVYVNDPPTGPNAGRKLQQLILTGPTLGGQK